MSAVFNWGGKSRDKHVEMNPFRGLQLPEGVKSAKSRIFESKELQDYIGMLAMLKHVRKGDTLHVHSMDRLARNLDDLRKIVKELTGKGVTVHFAKEQLTFTSEKNSMAELLLNVMGAFAEFERSLILERQREGIAIAKQKGAFKGRKRTITDGQIAEIKERAARGDKKAHIAKDLGISRETLYQYL